MADITFLAVWFSSSERKLQFEDTITSMSAVSREIPGGHEVLSVVFQIRSDELSVLLWRRAREPHAGRWSLPGGALAPDEGLDDSIRRQLASKVDVRELTHLEQLDTRGAPDRFPGRRVVATAYVGLIPADADPEIPDDTRWHRVSHLPRMAFDHATIVTSGLRRLRSKMSYTNLGFALAPPTFTMSELAGYYRAAMGYEVAPTNLQRILLRRKQIEPTGRSTTPGRSGGRPAALFRFRSRTLEITDAFAVLHPPNPQEPAPL
jgi:ADP-ribose pyrophosphatase YjhB (NUDIX family)